MMDREEFEAEASTFNEVTFCQRGEIGDAVGHVAVIRESTDEVVARLEAAARGIHWPPYWFGGTNVRPGGSA